jgi:hypothetical protein
MQLKGLLIIIIVLFLSLENVSHDQFMQSKRSHLNGSLSNTVQITLSTLCDAATSLLLVLLQNANLLKGLENLAIYAS